MSGVSFVVSTGGTNDAAVQLLVDSIRAENMPEYEIVIVGGASTTITGNDIKHISFDETIWSHLTIHGQPAKWPSRKYNLGVQASRYDIVVIMRDYITLKPGWYVGLESFGFDWDISIHPTELFNGERGDAWRMNQFPGLPRWCMVPYDIDFFLPYMLMPGNFWAAKRETMLQYPLDETLLWGMEEDTEWSKRVIPNCKITCNPRCIGKYTKPRPDDHNHTTDVNTMNSLAGMWDGIRRFKTKDLELSPQTKALQNIVLQNYNTAIDRTK